MLYCARTPEVPSGHDGGVIEGLSASRQLDLLKTLSVLESELKVPSSSAKHDSSDDCQSSQFKKASLREPLELPGKSAADILISIGKGMESSDIYFDLSGRSEPIYLELHALKDRLKSELNVELHTKDMESLVQEVGEPNQGDVNFTNLLILAQLNYDKWKRNRAKKSESKSARKEKEPSLKGPDMTTIMGVIKEASYKLISSNDDRINAYNVLSMDSSVFKEALENLNVQLSSRERKALEDKYLMDVKGNINFATFRADFVSLGSQSISERGLLRSMPSEELVQRNVVLNKNAVATKDDKISRSLHASLDASCSLENSMVLNILGSPGNTQKTSKGSQFMNKMVFTNVALEEIFAAALSANTTPSKQSSTFHALERRKSSMGHLKPLQFPLPSHSELVPELFTITPAEPASVAAIEGTNCLQQDACSHLPSTSDSDDDSETDKSSSRKSSTKDTSSAMTGDTSEISSTQTASRQASLSDGVEGSDREKDREGDKKRDKALCACPSNEEVIEAISRRAEEIAVMEKRASFSRARSHQHLLQDKRGSLSQLDSLCPKPDYVPGRRRYSRDPINHMKIIELTGRMEVKSGAVKSNKDAGRGSIESEKEELDEEVDSDSDSDDRPNKMQFEI